MLQMITMQCLSEIYSIWMKYSRLDLSSHTANILKKIKLTFQFWNGLERRNCIYNSQEIVFGIFKK